MTSIGLTGNMGSGKSLVSGIFRILGIPVYYADQESKKFLALPEVILSLKTIFGKEITDPGGNISRTALASVVFSDSEALKKLNALLHPLVRKDARYWATLHTESPYVIHEAAIIFESGFRNEYDQIIHVSCPQEVAIRRVIQRDGTSREEIMKRIRFQMDDSEKAALSDFVIRNDGSELLIPQVLAIHRQLTEKHG
jgi:dephospho-CoA kinase